jgi:hypothetical protein
MVEKTHVRSLAKTGDKLRTIPYGYTEQHHTYTFPNNNFHNNAFRIHRCSQLWRPYPSLQEEGHPRTEIPGRFIMRSHRKREGEAVDIMDIDDV